jgi:hypothetical protein
VLFLQKESLQIFGGWMLSTAPKLRLDGPRARERTCIFNGGQFANEIEVAGFNKRVYNDFIVCIVFKVNVNPIQLKSTSSMLPKLFLQRAVQKMKMMTDLRLRMSTSPHPH